MWTRQIKLLKLTETTAKKSNDVIVWDKTKTIILNDKIEKTLDYYPMLEKECVTGWLFHKHHITDIKNNMIKSHEKTIEITVKTPKASPCLIPFQKTIKIKSINIYHLTAYLQEKAYLFKDTAISESAAIATDEKIIYFAEDISRLNAIYKVLGQALLEKTPLNNHILLTSGKIDLTTVMLAHKANVSIVVSRTAPTQSAYNYANTNNITIIGFARRLKCSIYTAEHRLII